MKKFILLFFSFIASFIVVLDVYRETVTLTSLFIYLLSVVSCILFFANIQKKLSLKISTLISMRGGCNSIFADYFTIISFNVFLKFPIPLHSR